jgi:hypothetical protein
MGLATITNPTANLANSLSASKAELMKTIQMPKNLKNLSQRLPRAQYDNYEAELMMQNLQSPISYNPQEPSDASMDPRQNVRKKMTSVNTESEQLL